MSKNPGDGPDEQNPFKGTPFEQLFSGISGAGGGMPDLSALMNQMQAFMQPHDGPVNWAVVTDMARKVSAQEPDPTPTAAQRDAIADAVRLADHWLDDATDFPSGVTTTAAWSRAEWIVETTDVWKRLVEPIAGSAVGALGNALPEEARAMAGPLLGMLGKATGAMVASQVGQGVGALSSEVLGASDIGLPLGPDGKAALLPGNVEKFAAELDVSTDDVLLYLALREAAHQRLFANAHVAARAPDRCRHGVRRGHRDQHRWHRGEARPDRPDQPGVDAVGHGGRTLRPGQVPGPAGCPGTPRDHPGAGRGLGRRGRRPRRPRPGCPTPRSCRRPYAAGARPAARPSRPSPRWSASSCDPRRLRDASTLWGSLRTRQGTEGRDGVWMHPDLLPTAADLDDPLGFREDAATPESLSDEDFDAGLRELLDGPAEPDAGDERPQE